MSGIIKETYWRWYEYIKDDTIDEVIRVKTKVEIEIESWSIQQSEELLYPIRELKLNK